MTKKKAKKKSGKKTYKGLQDHVRSMKLPKIDTFVNQYADRDYEINLHITEFTCVCPKTGHPDFAEIYLTYVPDQDCVELKSFKEYLFAFRNEGIFHENLINRILDDVWDALKPRYVEIEGEFMSRGGIQTTVAAERGL